jgi:uncharacterized protein (TIGR02266 family)
MTVRRDSQMIPAMRPAAIAREKLGVALGQIQEIPDAPPDVGRVSELIARAIGALYDVQSSSPDDPVHVSGVKAAMEHLSTCLERLQEVTVRGPAIDGATATIAQTLAVLYPVSKVQAKGPMATPTPPPKPLPDDPRRSTRRHAVEADVGFQSESHFYTGFTQDVSEGGLFLATFKLQPIGTEMALSFTLPDGHLVSCTGTVRWIREYNDRDPNSSAGMGVQFKRLENEDRKAIERFLKDRPAIFYED